MRLGLSLSGGGFRATLYHLGVVRFLHDADLLKDVKDVVSVSGGSVIAAHLVLNWDRYTASAHDFDEAAAELLRFMDVDVRNGIVRRIPLQIPLRVLATLLRHGPDRRLTVNGLMEKYLDRYLFDGRSMHELPVRPKLHMLATSISEGGLLSFYRDGIYMQKRVAGQPDEMEHVPCQLAPISMVVAASAAFPGFFPPVQIRAKDVGAPPGDFPTQSLTDGGVYDNLGVRAYHWQRRLWMEQNATILAGELDPGCLTALATMHDGSPAALRWLASRLPESLRSQCAQPRADAHPELLAEIATLLEHLLKLPIHQQPEFADVKLQDAAAESLLAAAREGRGMLSGNQVWLNRRLLSSVLEQAVGRPVLASQPAGFDEVLVSDAGQPFLVLADRPHLGFLAQSMRASDILWDRVWQLEQDTFGSDPMFRFVPIHRMVSREADPTALHPVIQAEVPMIRTDLDRFSRLEARALIMHGYEVARAVFGHRIKDDAVRSNPPWDPFDKAPHRSRSAEPRSGARKNSPAPETLDAKSLQVSSQRKVWSTLLDWRDWPTYLYVPLLIFLLGFLPWRGWQVYKQSLLHASVVNSVAMGMPDFRKAMELVDEDPRRRWSADPVDLASALEPVDSKGWEMLNDTRIVDLRGMERGGWSRSGGEYYLCHSLRVRKLPDYQGNGRLTLVYPVRGLSPELRVKADEYSAKVLRLDRPFEVHGHPGSLTHVEIDLARLPHGDSVPLEIELLVRDAASLKGYWVRYTPTMPTEVANIWLLFPPSRPYHDYKLRSFVPGENVPPESEDPRYVIDHPFGAVIAWSLANPEQGRTYECRWTWD